MKELLKHGIPYDKNRTNLNC